MPIIGKPCKARSQCAPLPPVAMKCSSAPTGPSCPPAPLGHGACKQLDGLPHPESRHTVMTKLESNEYVLKVPRGGKSAVWKIFLHVTNMHGHKIDFVLCRYCCGLFMYKGYASGTSSLMNHGIRCIDRPKQNPDTGSSDTANANVLVQEEWQEALKNQPYFSLNFLKRVKTGTDSRSPSPLAVPPMQYAVSFKLEAPQGGGPVEEAEGRPSSFDGPRRGNVNNNKIKLEYPNHSDQLQHIPLYTALHVAAQSYGLNYESLLKITDGMAAVGGGQRSMMQDEESGSGGGSAGLCGIEAVVAAAAAAAAAADESSVNTATSSGGMVVTSGGAATSLPIGGGGGMAGSCQRPPVVGMSPPSAPTTPNKPESYQLRHNNHLSLVLNQLAEDEAFMDVTLTADGRQVKAHKSVLSAVSPYFSSVLRANPCQHPIIIMPRDIRYSELSSIIMYIYKGEMTVSAEDLPSLLKTAELLRITGLSPGENSNSQQQFSRHSSSSSNAFLSSGVNAMTTVNNQNTSISSSNNSISMTSRGSNSGRQQPTSQHQRSQESPISKQVEKMSKPQTTEIESPPPPEHTMLNPSDFMDLDMTCVKEELNSDNEEEDTETSSREVTTPPPMGNPPSPDKDKTSTSPHSQPTLDPDTTRSTRSPSLKTDTTSQDTNQEADDMKLNSLKTLANLASLDTPTNLSPSDSPSPVASYDPSPNVCPYCSEYVTGEQIKSHLSSKHAFKPAHVCDTCFRVYTKKNLFELHTKECSKES